MEESKLICIPMVIQGNSPFVNVNVNGNELTFLVDSGAGLSVYDKKYISCLGITEDQQGDAITDISGIGNNSFGGNMVVIFFQVVDMRFANPFSVTELGETFRAFKDSIGEVAGIIGGDFLYNYEAIIDYSKSEIRIDKAKITSVMQAIMGQE